MTDRRLTPANGRVAHVSFRGVVEAERYVAGTPARIAVPLADLLAGPGGPRDRQVLMGEKVAVLDRHEGFAFVQGPLLQDVETVARVGYRAAMRGRRVAVPGLLNRFGTILGRFAPRALVLRSIARMQSSR